MVKWLNGCCAFGHEEREELPVSLQPVDRPKRRSMIAGMFDPSQTPVPTPTPNDAAARGIRETWEDAVNPGVSYEARVWAEPNDPNRHTGEGIRVTQEVSITYEPNPDYNPELEASREATAARRRANNKKKKQRQQAKKKAAREQSGLEDAGTSTAVNFVNDANSDENTVDKAGNNAKVVDKIGNETNGNSKGILKDANNGTFKNEHNDDIFQDPFDDYYSPIDEDPDKQRSFEISQTAGSPKSENKC